MQTLTPGEQIESLRARLTQLYVARDNTAKQLENTETEIVAVRNMLAGVQLGREAERFETPQPVTE